jgi:hypothetical protein
VSFTVLVTGGRNYQGRERVNDRLDALAEAHADLFVIEGGATGADQWARAWRINHRRPGRTYRADWHIHGKKAGIVRNAEMLAEGRPNLVLAFPGGRGTLDMVNKATIAGVPVEQVT